MAKNFLTLKSDQTQTLEGWEKWYKKDNPWGYVGDFNDRIRNQILLNFVRWGKLERGLDIACGEGSVTKALSPYIKSIKAFDISSKAIDSAKRNAPAENIEYFQKDIKDFSSEIGTFDFILCSEVIYYLEPKDIEKLFIEIKKSLENDGYFILSTRTDYWYSFEDLVEILQEHFRVINITPIWRPEKWIYKAIKRFFSIFSPLLDRIYKGWLLTMDPQKPGNCIYVCIKK